MSKEIKKVQERPLSEMSEKALELLKSGETLTVADIKGKGLEKINSSHLTALVTRGLVEAVDTVIEVPTIVKRKVKAYTIVK